MIDDFHADAEQAMTPDENAILIRLDAKVDNLHRELLGNGQPGRIGTLESKVDKHGSQMDFWRGAIAIVGFLMVLMGGGFIWHVLTGK